MCSSILACADDMESSSGDVNGDYLDQCLKTCSYLRGEINCTRAIPLEFNDTICVCKDDKVLDDSGVCVEEYECQCRGFDNGLVDPEANVTNSETCDTWYVYPSK